MVVNSLLIKSVILVFSLTSSLALAGTDGSVSGVVSDSQDVALGQIEVQLLNTSGNTIKQTTTSVTGEFNFFPVTFGDYQISVKAKGFAPYIASIHVVSGGNTQANAKLSLGENKDKEMVLNVVVKKHLVQNTTSVSSAQITQDDIAKVPQGETVKLPKLLSSTVPGVVPGPFGQSFIRGNHANIQYQIDGVQLPDSPSNTFGEAFTPRNIDHMEVITGGVAAEYGERLAAVINIATKSGAETPGGEAEVDYGSYNTSSPFALYSGSNAAGDVHYFLSAGAFRTDRGLDTPEPTNEQNENQGGNQAIHDFAWGHSQFAKVDWLVDNSNKYSFIAFNSFNFYQIPNLPSSFSPSDPYFTQTDQYGNSAINWAPSTTDDEQAETNSYFQVVWKHSFSDHSFLQLAPYYKYSYIGIKNDPTNDLSAALGPVQVPNSNPSSFTESRPVNNYGLKADYTERLNDENLFKTGIQLQGSQATGGVTVISAAQSTQTVITSSDNSITTGFFESAYVQDDYTISKPLTLNVGLRADAIQFNFASNTYSSDALLQPRIGINYLLAENTKLHAFYGKLFQPAPAENLRDTFVATGSGSALTPYDIKAEKDDYYEVGIAQQIAQQAFFLNVYYKDAVNMLDDTQLLNTSVAQPYNFARGFAWGVELSTKGDIASHWSDFFNYSYEIAMGCGISGGLFAFENGAAPPNTWQFLDHVQIQTATAGVTYHSGPIYWSTQALFGSGLRTDPNNGTSLPTHLTYDTSVGYEFQGETWLEKWKVSGDVLNIFNNVYPITIANGFNGSHYAAGTQYFVHLIKEL
jgi:outer membrane receptor protein involved in Fe transport